MSNVAFSIIWPNFIESWEGLPSQLLPTTETPDPNVALLFNIFDFTNCATYATLLDLCSVPMFTLYDYAHGRQSTRVKAAKQCLTSQKEKALCRALETWILYLNSTVEWIRWPFLEECPRGKLQNSTFAHTYSLLGLLPSQV